VPLEPETREKVIAHARQILNNIESTPPVLRSARELANIIREVHEKDKNSAKEIARTVADVLSEHPYPSVATWKFVDPFWEMRGELLDRATGKFFHHLMREVLRRELLSPKAFPDKATQLALLAVAGHHDDSIVKRLPDELPFVISDRVVWPLLAGGIPVERVLGRRAMAQLLDRVGHIATYLSLLRKVFPDRDLDSLMEIIPVLEASELKRVERELGRNVSWAELWVKKILEQAAASTNIEQLDEEIKKKLHPDELRAALLYIYANKPKIDERLLTLRGKDFIRYKFGEHADLILKIKEAVEEGNERRRKYVVCVPDDPVSHVAAQINSNACTGWEDVFTGILHGPSVPIVVKERDSNRVVGRIFLTLARDSETGQYYPVLGDYEGEEKGKPVLGKVIKERVAPVTKKYLGVEPVSHAYLVKKEEKLLRRLRAPHENPWIISD